MQRFISIKQINVGFMFFRSFLINLFLNRLQKQDFDLEEWIGFEDEMVGSRTFLASEKLIFNLWRI